MKFDALPDVLTPNDLYDYLPVGRNAIYELLKQGKIACVRSGRKLLIPKTALAAFLESGGEPALSPI